MNANDITAQLLNELQLLMINHEKLREIMKQNKKDKQDLGFLQKDEPQNQDKPSQDEQLYQVQIIGKKQKRELKFLNNEYINQVREKNRLRKQVTKKKVEQQKFTDYADKIIKIQDFQNSIVQKEENIIMPETIKKQIYDDAMQYQIIHQGAQNQKLQKEVCNLCNKEFKNILVLTDHLEKAHQISFSSWKLQLLKKQRKQ
ncbi:hypothetical protein pb186bvf_011666 [Paramecium bursaria]